MRKFLRRVFSRPAPAPSEPQSTAPSSMVRPPKKVAPAYIDAFWERWRKREKKGARLTPGSVWTRNVHALSPSTMVTVRRFSNFREAMSYVRETRKLERRVMKKNPKHFTIQPVQFFGRRRANLLERVYRGPDLHHFEFEMGRYYDALKRRLKRKGIDLDNPVVYNRILEKAREARDELGRMAGTFFDFAPSNILLLDYDPKTDRFLLAFVDHGLSIKEGH